MSLTVEEAARRLGLHPVEVVTLLLTHRQEMPRFRVPEGLLPALRTWAGVEDWWREEEEARRGTTLDPDHPRRDPDPRRRIIRWIPYKLLQKGKVGGSHTRIDNAWRGLPGDLRGFGKAVVALLKREGLLLTKPTVNGEHVFLNPQRLDTIRALIRWEDPPAPFRELMAGR